MTDEHSARRVPMTQGPPLAGRTVLVTRPLEQAGRLSAALAAYGAIPIEVPAIRIEPPASWAGLDAAIAQGGYDWVIFTSVNGVAYFWQRLEAAGGGSAWFARTRVAAIGPETGKALAARGVRPDLVPEEYVTEALVACLADGRDLHGVRVLLPRADIARDALQRGLWAAGASVDCVVAYRTAPAEAPPDLLARLRAGEVDVATFTSSSTVRALVQMLGGDLQLLAATVVACIGPVTARAAQSAGLRVDIVADQYTIPGLVDALVRYFAAQTGHADAGRRSAP